MKFISTPIQGLLIIEPQVWKDKRGYFYESYNRKLFEEAGINKEFLQDNQSLSQRGTLRGLHAQAPPYEQAKLVRVVRGKVLDVAVDIRTGSPTYGQSFSVELSGDNFKMLWIPIGFLHGFVTIEDQTIFAYKVSNFYHEASEFGVRWDDADLQINWCLAYKELILSKKDGALPYLKDMVSPFYI